MILSDKSIETLALQKQMVIPFDRAMLNPASLDIRVGQNLLLATPMGWEKVDLREYSPYNPYRFNPNDFVLVESLELFNFPNNICGEFKLKSSRGREGYDHGEAGFIDPSWTNSRLTMEIKNIHPYKFLPLYLGMRIGQIVFMQLDDVPSINYAQVGNYNNDVCVQVSKAEGIL